MEWLPPGIAAAGVLHVVRAQRYPPIVNFVTWFLVDGLHVTGCEHVCRPCVWPVFSTYHNGNSGENDWYAQGNGVPLRVLLLFF